MHPQVVLTFANRAEGDQGFLRALEPERDAIEFELRVAREAHLCGVDTQFGVTRDGLIKHLQTTQAAEFAVIFHYGGHASGSALALQYGDATAKGVAALLGDLPRLHFVFLNGCSTAAQVDALLDLGVPVVLATRADVKDGAATEFAMRFYRRLGEGATIQAAYDNAVVAVQTTHTSLTVSRKPSSGSARFTPKKPTAEFPWQLHTRPAPGAADPRQWSLPLAAEDELFVLPQPQASTPTEPYRGAEPYRVQDAAIFRGRGPEIRQIYDDLIEGESAVVVMHGPAGVGRTSMVQAGLLSRLRIEHAASAVLPETLDDVFSAAPEVLLVDEAERLTKVQTLAVLAMSPRVLFSVRSAQAKTLTATITEAGHGAVLRPLGHLDEAAIERVIREVTRIFPFRYAPNLPKRLATDLAGHGAAAAIGAQQLVVEKTDLLGGLPPSGTGYATMSGPPPPRKSAVVGATTPITSAVLWALWMGRCDGEVADDQYEQFKRDGHLDSFVRDGLAALAAEDSEWVESGFALDLLAHHRTLLGKLRGHTLDGLKGRYAHREDVEAFIEAACVHRLLVQTPDGAGTLLAHDLLAPLIGSRFAHSRAPAQQARRIVEERLPSWADGKEGATLDANDLLTIEAGRAGMPVLNADGLRMTEASARAVVAKARRRRALRSALAGAAILVLTLAFFWNQGRLEAQHSEAEKTQLVQARDLAAGLVEAYRKLEDPTPQRAAAGAQQLAALVHANPAMAPDVARLAVRAWSMVLAAPDTVHARMARPNVIGRGARSRWVDLAGRVHALDVAPDSWFVLPTGNTIAIHSQADQRLRIYDARTGDLIGAHVLPRFTSIVQFEKPEQVIVVQDLETLAEEMRLLIIDGTSGAGAGLHVAGWWRGDCDSRIFAQRVVDGVAAPPSDAAWFAFDFDASGALRTMPATDSTDQTRFDDCVRKVVPAHAPAPEGMGLIEPAWRRWQSVEAPAAAAGLLLSGRTAPVPAPPSGDDFWPPDQGCEPGCYLLDPTALEFASAQGDVLAGMSRCTDRMHSDPVVRACRGTQFVTAPVSPSVFDPDNVEAVLAGARRRGEFLLIAGHLLRFSDFAWVPLEVSGTPRDFAISPSGEALIVLTDTRMHIFKADADGQFSARDAMAADAVQGPALRVRFLDNDRVFIQRANDVLLIALQDQSVIWRRAEYWHRTDRENAGLAVGSSVGAGIDLLAVRRGDHLRLLAAMDGTPLTPVEFVDGLTPSAAVAIEVVVGGGVQVHDGARRFERAPVPDAFDTGQFVKRQAASSATPPLPEVRAKSGLEDSGPRCAPGVRFSAGQCWATTEAETPAPSVCAGDGPDLAFLHRVLDHLTTRCVPERGKRTYDCGVLDDVNAARPGDSPWGPQAAARIKLLLRVRRVRHAAVDQAIAWVKRCRPETADRLSVALRHLGRGLSVYNAQTFEDCESACGGLDSEVEGSQPLAPQTRESDECFTQCWAGGAGADVGGMRGMLRFVHSRGPKGVSVGDLGDALKRARAALDTR